MSAFEPPGECPICGEWVEAKAAACRHCGACPETGWSEETLYDGLDLPAGVFDEPGAAENPPARKTRPGAVPRWAVAVAILLALVLLVWTLGFG